MIKVRRAYLFDFERCEHMDPSYVTYHMWRMRDDQKTEQLEVWFERVRLPRPMPVRPPYRTEGLFKLGQNGRRLLVAEEDKETQGYLCCRAGLAPGQLFLEQLVVDRAYRRRGVGTVLLEAARRLAQSQGFWQIQAVVQCQNDPAVQFLTSYDCAWSGYIDPYDQDGDVGLVFSRRV